MSLINKLVKKPKGYKSHFIVCDPVPTLIVNVDYSHFQQQMNLSDDGMDEFEVTEEGDSLRIKQIDPNV